jgi:hypothetical protein
MQTLSLEEYSKGCQGCNGLSSKYRREIPAMKMTKSTQKCMVCYSKFAKSIGRVR